MLKITKMLAILLVVSAVSMPAAAQWTQEYKLTGAAAGDSFGKRVDVSGDVAIIATRSPSPKDFDLYDVTTGDQLHMVTPPDPGFISPNWNGQFAIDGNLAVTGVFDWSSTDANVYLFDVTTGDQLAVIQPDAEPVGRFAWSVDISGDILIVGASNVNGPGSLYVFDVSTPSAPVQLGEPIIPPGLFGKSRFAWNVGINGTTAIAGTGRDQSDTGAAWLFDLSPLVAGTGPAVGTKLTADDGVAGDWFGGGEVDIEGNIAIVGSQADIDGFDNAGAAYLFDVSTGDQLAKLTSDAPGEGYYFGRSVDISGSTAIVAEYGGGGVRSAAYLFDVSDPEAPVQIQKITSSASDDNFGVFAAIDGNVALVSAHADDEVGENAGAVYVFRGPPIVSPAAGDVDGDGDVDLADMGHFENQFGGPGVDPHNADLNEDGLADLHDLVLIRDTFGYTSPTAPSAATPEPATMTLLAISGLLVLRRRRS